MCARPQPWRAQRCNAHGDLLLLLGSTHRGTRRVLQEGSSTVSENTTVQVHELVDAVYRSAARQILATLIRLLGDFDAAEEALHDAFAVAVEHWSQHGVPANPRAWLISTGRFK